jgi:tight adherence protein B
MTALPFAALAAWALWAMLARPVRRRPEGTLERTGAPMAAVRGHLAAAAARWDARRRPEVGLPEAVDSVAAAVGAGRSIVDGLAAAAAVAPPALAAELDSVVAAVGRGLPVVPAVERWAATSDVDGAPLVATAVGLAADAGGDVEDALAGVASTLRERRALTREIRALSSQARASAATITVAPVGFGGVAALADGDTARFLFGTPAGLGCLVVGLVLDLVGFRWMQRLAGRIR